MPSRSLRAALPAAALCLATVLSAPPALAAKVMELEADQLIRAASYLRESLTLTPNQQILFQQVNGKSAAILRARGIHGVIVGGLPPARPAPCSCQWSGW